VENRCSRLDALRTARSGAASVCTRGDAPERELDAGAQPHRVVTDIRISVTPGDSPNTERLARRLGHALSGLEPDTGQYVVVALSVRHELLPAKLRVTGRALSEIDQLQTSALRTETAHGVTVAAAIGADHVVRFQRPKIQPPFT
jgi:hypothetical protein